MQSLLYIIKKLGIKKSLTYIVLYPSHLIRKALARLDDIHDEIRWQKKIFKYLKKAGLNDHGLKKKRVHNDTKEYFKKYGFDINTDWMYFYEQISGKKSKRYIPEDIFYREIEPQFIHKKYLRIYGDKNMYDLLFKGVKQPTSFLRYFDKKFYSSDYNLLTISEITSVLNKISSPWIIKPSIDSGNGIDIKNGTYQHGILTLDGAEVSVKELTVLYSSGFIIQEKITSQMDTLAQFHPESLNTIRITTLRLNKAIYVINKHAKFGTEGRIADNNEGIWCGIDDNGIIHSHGINSNFQTYEHHPNSGIKFKGTKVEEFKKLTDFAIQLHKDVLRIDLISWDVAFSNTNEPIFIECNTNFQGITYHQALNGPLFGDLTDDVLAEVVRRKKGNPA